MSNGRKVSTDALETLGQIIDATQKRDAIHLAVLPMVAGGDLSPGEAIQVRDGMAFTTSYEKATGIVDPFLPLGPETGQRFWMVLKPRMVTSLRHVWSHPAFADEPGTGGSVDTAKSEAWLRAFCDVADCPPYDELIPLLMGGHGEYGDSSATIEDDYLFFSGVDAHGDIPPEFWGHVETVTGVKFSRHPAAFSCSC